MDQAPRPESRTETESESDRARRLASRARLTHALGELMAEREDLRGVHALADLVADSARWSA